MRFIMIQLLKAFHDVRAYFLILPFCLLLWWTDPVVFETWVQWGAALPIIVGVTLLVRKIIFNTVDLSEVIEQACKSSTGAGLVFLGVAVFSAVFLIAATLWLSH